MLRRRALMIAVLMAVLAGFATSALAKEKLLADIESQADLRGWNKPKGTLEVSREMPLKGKASAKVTPGTYLNLGTRSGIPGDWSGYDVLKIDFNNTTGKSLRMSILVGDKDWANRNGGTYWNRYNGSHSLPPGKYTFCLPVSGLFRGEAGSRYNDLKHPIDPKGIIRIDFGIGKKSDGNKPIYMDNIRLVTERLPRFIKAFDFGIPQQMLQPGFTAVAVDTAYTKQKGYGLRVPPRDPNRARDDTFPTTLYRDWICMSEGDGRSYEFMVDVPNGKYRVFTVFSDCGYWGGEAMRHTRRSIEAEGQVKWSEDLGDKGNYWKPNFLFENVEPLIGQDFWNLYMKVLFEPKRFSVDVRDGQLNLKFPSDRPWSARVNCVIIYPESKKAEGDRFCAEIVDKQRKEFTVAAAEHVPPAGGTMGAMPLAERAKGYIFFVTDYEKDTYLTTIPDRTQIRRDVSISACLGENEPFSFAVRPIRNMGKASVKVSDFKGEAGTIGADNFRVKVVRHLSRRGFGAINYRIIPQMLKDFDAVDLPKDITREFVVTMRVPKDAKAGKYAGTVTLSSTGGINETLRVKLTVYPFTLDESEYLFCFFGYIPDVKLAKMLREYGFNSFSGGKRTALNGFDADGTPQLDFSGMDRYMEMLKKAGYTQEGWGYGGFTIQHIGYTKDEAFFGKWERATGLSYDQLLKNVFDAMKKHRDEEGWLPGVYGMVDETRNREVAKRQIAQINAVNRAAPWLKTAGSYSVSYAKGADPNNYHQWIFEALDASSLNRHDESVMKKARELGKEIYIYNQGQSRYSFGAYQWSEYRKGVKGRQQWHLHVQHGFQFFDLDGREPDTGVVYYGENGPIPTLALIRSAEGADDFYYCQTLHNRIEKLKGLGGAAGAVVKKARAILDKIETKIKINERRKPAWLNNRKLKADCAKAIMELDVLFSSLRGR